MGTPTVTPNIGLQIPAFGQGNWQVPTNYNWNVLDNIFGGTTQVPALNVIDLTVANLTAANIITLLTGLTQTGSLVPPSGGPPQTTFSIAGAVTVNALIAVFFNGVFMPPGSYTLDGSNNIVFNAPISYIVGEPAGYVVYFGTA